MLYAKPGLDGQPMMRATGGPGIGDDPSLWHSLEEWQALAAETVATAVSPEHRLDRIGKRAYAKLNGGPQPRAAAAPAPLARDGGFGGLADQVYARQRAVAKLPQAQAEAQIPKTMAAISVDGVYAKYNASGREAK